MNQVTSYALWSDMIHKLIYPMTPSGFHTLQISPRDLVVVEICL